jgi:hypothetical protein
MSKIFKSLKSRTVWTAIVIFLFNGFQAIEGSIPSDVYMIVNGVLALAIGYFRANPQAEL